jgi:hypothetical protein
MVLGSSQPLTEMSTRKLPGGKGRPAREADNLTATCEPIVWKMWEPRRLTTLWAFTACYRDSFTFFIFCAYAERSLYSRYDILPVALLYILKYLKERKRYKTCPEFLALPAVFKYSLPVLQYIFIAEGVVDKIKRNAAIETLPLDIQRLCLAPVFTPVYFLAYSSTLKMETTCSSETSVYFQRDSTALCPRRHNSL